MFSELYNREIVEDYGVQGYEIDLPTRSISVRRSYAGKNERGQIETVNWRCALTVEQREQLPMVLDNGDAEPVGTLLWPPSYVSQWESTRLSDEVET